MIPFDAITEWSVDRPWPTRDQVEQDLLLSRGIIAIARHPLLSVELVFRGGTALHKLHIKQPLRYSEDLDYVRASSGGIQPITRALTELGEELGYKVNSRMSQQPKIWWRTTSQTGSTLKIKVEINTHERSPALPLLKMTHVVTSTWWSGSASVLTFQIEELIATKIRALYQRNKGRDLFDLWLALDRLDLDPKRILSALVPYRPQGLTSRAAVANLRSKINDVGFRSDIIPLVRDMPAGYRH